MTQSTDSMSAPPRPNAGANRPVAQPSLRRMPGGFAELYKKLDALKKSDMLKKMAPAAGGFSPPRALAASEHDAGKEVSARRRPSDEQDDTSSEGGADISKPGDLLDSLDPLQRALWQDGPPRLDPLKNAPVAPAATASPPTSPVTGPELELAVERFLKRFAMSGDRRRGTAHLEIGSGELAGGTLTVNAEGEHVELIVNAPPGANVQPYTEALTKRLNAKGISHTLHVT